MARLWTSCWVNISFKWSTHIFFWRVEILCIICSKWLGISHLGLMACLLGLPQSFFHILDLIPLLAQRKRYPSFWDTLFESYVYISLKFSIQQVKNPQRDLPMGIGLALSICCALYMLVSAVIVGLVPYYAMDPDTPISSAFASHGLHWAAYVNISCICDVPF